MKKAFFAVGLVTTLVLLVLYLQREKALVVSRYTTNRGTVELTVSNTRAGTVKACRRSALSMPIGGRVEFLYVKEGDQVEALRRLRSIMESNGLSSDSLFS